MNGFLNLNINTTNLPTTYEKFPFIPEARLRSYFKNSCIGFHQGFQTLETMKARGLRPRAFISFLVAAEKFYIFWCLSPIVVSSALLP